MTCFLESALMPYTPSPCPAINRALVFAPHPDDEIFGCGGMVRLLANAGAKATAVVLSDGALGGDNSDGRLFQRREAESRAAAAVVGYAELRFWGLPDRGLQADEALIARLAQTIQDDKPDWVFAPALTELHPDHQAAALAAIEAFRRAGGGRTLAFYEISAPLPAPNMLLDISAVAAVKQQAMACFVSQLQYQPYHEQIAALNRYRSYTLGPQVTAAEAYLLCDSAALAQGVERWFMSPRFRA